MKAWLISIAGLALAGAQAAHAQSSPPAKPHLHYEIILNPDPKGLNPTQRLERACTLAKAVTARMHAERDAELAFDLTMLRWVSCGKPDPY